MQASSAAEHELDKAAERHIRKVQQNMRILMMRQYSSQRRQEAAYWLGESGEPRAISALRQVYLRDSDRQVQRAARLALGKFRALQQALEGEPAQREQALNLLRQIVYQGRTGRRLPLPVWAVLMIEALLALTALMMLILGITLLMP